METQNKTIALLEDDVFTREEVSEALRRNNYKVVSAGSQKDFLKKIESINVDIFLIDLVLPDGNGLDTIRGLKDRFNCGIIILSGQSDDIDKIVGLEIGADDYITKPFNPRELLARIGSLFRRLEFNSVVADTEARCTSNQIIPFGNWVLHTGSRQLISPNNTEVALTGSEFDLLSFFLNNPNRVLSREVLISSIRGRDWAGYDRAMDGLVSRIRQKIIKEDSDFGLIKTIHGVGYLFIIEPR